MAEVILLRGRPGVGKTTVSNGLQARLHIPIIRKDDIYDAVAGYNDSVLKPDVLVVALGAPYAERWIHKYKGVLHAKIAIGVGGSLDVVAGTVPRAPMIWRKLNIEWLFRLLNQPSRWRRQLLLPRFAWKALVYRDK